MSAQINLIIIIYKHNINLKYKEVMNTQNIGMVKKYKYK